MALKLPPRLRRIGGAYYYRRMVDGKRTTLPLGTDYAVALAKWAEIEGSTANGSTVTDAIRRYIADELATLAPKTRADRLPQLDRLRATYGHMRLDQVRPVHIAQYLDARGRRHPRSANMEIAVLGRVYALAMRWGWVDRNPCAGVRRLPERARDRYITDDELQRLLDTADERLADLIEGAYLTALRRGDLLALRWADIVEGEIRVKTGKTGKVHRIKVETDLEQLLARQKRRKVVGQVVFARRGGKPWTATGLNSAWRRLREKTGIDAHWHDLRAKAVTDIRNSRGRDAAQDLAGHIDGSMTEVYVRARDGRVVRPASRNLGKMPGFGQDGQGGKTS